MRGFFFGVRVEGKEGVTFFDSFSYCVEVFVFMLGPLVKREKKTVVTVFYTSYSFVIAFRVLLTLES